MDHINPILATFNQSRDYEAEAKAHGRRASEKDVFCESVRAAYAASEEASAKAEWADKSREFDEENARIKARIEAARRGR